MAKRDSNIVLNTIDDGEPAVQRRADAEESTDNEPPHDESTDEPTDGVENPDGSITEYATPKEPPGTSTTENVPGDPLAAEIQRFKDHAAHPEDWTDLEIKALAKQRRCPDLSDDEISKQLDISKAVIRRGQRKVAFTELAAKDKIRERFEECSTVQQIVIAANLTGASDYSTAELAEMADCKPGSIGTARRRLKPLIRRVEETGLPNPLIPQPIRDDPTETDDDQATDETDETTTDVSESSDTKAASDETDTTTQTETVPEREAIERVSTNTTEHPATASRSPVEEVRQFVTVLREAATKEHSLSGSPTAQQGTAARQATCEAILNYIDQRISNEQ